LPIKPSELMSDVARCVGDQPLSMVILFIANRSYDLTDEHGRKLSDPSDFKHVLIECYHAQLKIEGAPVPREWQECPRCGHIYIDPKECGFPVGPRDIKCGCTWQAAA